MNKYDNTLEDIINKFDSMTIEELQEELEKWGIEFVETKKADAKNTPTFFN